MWFTISYIAGPSRPSLRRGCCYDWFKTDTTYSEETLTSSREGEIEADSEKHKV